MNVNLYKKLRSYGLTPDQIRRAVRYPGRHTVDREPCNCGDRILHNNGGNYHAVTFLHNTEHGLFLEETNTREDFPGDEIEYWVLTPTGKVVNVWGWYGEHALHRTNLEIVFSTREGEATYYGSNVGEFSEIRDMLDLAVKIDRAESMARQLRIYQKISAGPGLYEGKAVAILSCSAYKAQVALNNWDVIEVDRRDLQVPVDGKLFNSLTCLPHG